MLPVGSRGDVQPYVALAVGLKQAGHEIFIPAPAQFRGLVTEAGLDYHENDGFNPQALTEDPELQAALEQGGQLRGLLAVIGKMRSGLESLLDKAWELSEGADAVIAPLMPWGTLDSAEKRGIPGIWAPLHPMYPTRAFPNPFLAPGKLQINHRLNRVSYALLRSIAGMAGRRIVNRWRRDRLGLPPRPFFGTMAHMDARCTPTLYAFSRYVLPPPDDWPTWHQMTGYWFLDEPDDWQPPDEIARFLEAGSPPVFVGFGSMGDRDVARITRTVIEAIQMSGQRGIIQSGWMGLGDIDLPDSILRIDSVLHSWLFPQMAAVVHHGGMGTTAAGLRAGVPSIITPVLGDQFFWAKRVAQLGVGLSPARYTKLTVDGLAGSITRTVNDTDMQTRATQLGAQIQAEDGVGMAVRLIEDIVAKM